MTIPEISGPYVIEHTVSAGVYYFRLALLCVGFPIGAVFGWRLCQWWHRPHVRDDVLGLLHDFRARIRSASYSVYRQFREGWE